MAIRLLYLLAGIRPTRRPLRLAMVRRWVVINPMRIAKVSCRDSAFSGCRIDIGLGYGAYAQGPSYSHQVPMQQQQYNYPQGGFRNDMHPSMDPLGHRGSYSQDMSALSGRGPGLTTSQANGMYTRNLIGSLACSAARLTDPSEKIGIWFVLQDMSVRTEGWFR